MIIMDMKKIHRFDAVYDSQQVFRCLLTAMSNPARRVNIKPFADKLYGENTALLALAMTLLDNEVSFNACDNAALADEIVSLTLSREEALEAADYIFITDADKLSSAIAYAKCGTLRDPHQSATMIVKNAGPDACRLRIYGPGVRGTGELFTTELVRQALDLRDRQYYEYPQGVDMIFVSAAGDLFSLPRRILREVP